MCVAARGGCDHHRHHAPPLVPDPPRYGRLPDLNKQLKAAEDKVAAGRGGGSRAVALLKQEVTEQDIAEIIAKWTGACSVGWLVVGGWGFGWELGLG